MAEDRVTLRAIAWQQVFPSLRILSALRIALNFKALLLGAIGAAGMVAGWRLLGQLFADPDRPGFVTNVNHYTTWPWERLLFHEPVEALALPDNWFDHSPIVMAWDELTSPFRQMFESSAAENLVSFTYLLSCGLWALLIWAFFGAAISRQAAVAFARQENTSLAQLAVFTSPRWTSYFVAPLFPIVGVILMAAFMALVGLAMRADLMVPIAAVLWGFVLLGGFMMAFLLIGLFFGFPLMWGSISAEGTDAFGALSHSYSYVYQRPLHYLGYGIIAAIVGVLGWFLVSLFVDTILILSTWGITWGSGFERWADIQSAASKGVAVDTGSAIISFWTNCLYAVAHGFVFSYFWSATTVIYFLLRRLVDATEMDEIYLAEEHEQHGLPPLKTGPDGMPTVVDDPSLTGDEASVTRD